MYIVRETQGDSEVLDLTQLELAFTTIIYAPQINEYGQQEWVEYQRLQSPEENRIWRSLNEISPHLQHAFIAVEDENFYTHIGFSLKRTVLAALNEVFHKLTGSYLPGQSGQLGASTIEQQLIKNITGEDQSSGMEGYTRKLKEIFRAIAMDNRFSKEEILEAYLNTIGLTDNIAGIYFMLQQGYITESEAEEAYATPLRLVERVRSEEAAVQTNYSWFTDYVIEEVTQDLLEENPLNRENWDRAAANAYLYNGGLRIYATVDPKVQSPLPSRIGCPRTPRRAPSRKPFPRMRQASSSIIRASWSRLRAALGKKQATASSTAPPACSGRWAPP